MHSLKNTIVAVGLLGLSFLFYQASTKPNPNAHLSEGVPDLSISDGTDGFSKLTTGKLDSGIDAIKSKLNSLPNLEMPDLSKPKQMVSDMASDFKNELNNKAAQLKEKVNEGISDFQLEMPNLNTPNLNAPTSEAPRLEAPRLEAPMLKTDQPAPIQFNAPAALSNHRATPAPTQQMPVQQPLDNTARDQGLIAALQSQVQQTVDSSNDFHLDNTTQEKSSEFQFASQPIPSGDSSFNQLAADSRSIDAGSNVFRADTAPMDAGLRFEEAWARVDQLVEAKDFYGALRLLSQYYRRDDISGPQRQRLNGWLDALAGKVIFSTEHHLDQQPFTVSNESLTDISSNWGVPAQLIYNINKAKIANPAFVDSGTELKVVRGPFSCEIDLSSNVMTLFLGNLYAGRYPVKIGISGNPRPGEYRVLAKSIVGHSWRDAAGNEYPPGSPQNGYGPNWIGLSESLCIHAVGSDVTGTHTGCIGLNSKDAKDVFGILGKTSLVKIVE